jgi:hypothetical protein
MNQSQFFIGYATLEEWAKMATEKVAFAMTVETTQTRSNGYSVHELALVVSQPKGNLVHYVRMEIDNLRYLCGTYFGKNGSEQTARRRVNQIWAIVQEWLEEQGYTISKAMVATPKNVHLTNGWADFLAYDQEKDQYYRAEGVLND